MHTTNLALMKKAIFENFDDLYQLDIRYLFIILRYYIPHNQQIEKKITLFFYKVL